MTSLDGFSSRVNNPAPQSKSSSSKRPLGNIAKFASPKSKNSSLGSPVVDRYHRQSLARELMPNERVARCHRFRAPLAEVVQVKKGAESGRVYYSGLEICSSVWMCPVCAARISEGRRQELTAALLDAHITNSDGSRTPLYAMLVTYTFSHNRSMSCLAGVQGITAAFRRLKSGKAWQLLKDEYGLVGSVRALESTHTEQNGWHPHIHDLMLTTQNLNEAALRGLEKALKLRWPKVLAKEGFTASLQRGVTIDRDRDGVSGAAAAVLEYIAKFGHEPKERPDKERWTIAHEVTKAVVKQANSEYSGRTPQQLLVDYDLGDIRAGRLWQEYARAFKGRKQLFWSSGLRDLLGLGVEKDDGDLAAETESKVDRLLASLDADQWRAILRGDLRGELLYQAQNSSDENFNLWLADVLSRWLPLVQGVSHV